MANEQPLPLHRRLAGMIVWTIAMFLFASIIGGVSAALIALITGTGFGEQFLQKWRTIGLLFSVFLFSQPVGQRLGEALKQSPRLPLALKWTAIALTGTVLFAVVGPIAGPLFDGNDLADRYGLIEQLYAFFFLLSVAAGAAFAVFKPGGAP